MSPTKYHVSDSVTEPDPEPLSPEEQYEQNLITVTVIGSIVSLLLGRYVQKCYPNFLYIWVPIALAGAAISFFFRERIYGIVKILLGVLICFAGIAVIISILYLVYNGVVLHRDALPEITQIFRSCIGYIKSFVDEILKKLLS